MADGDKNGKSGWQTATAGVQTIAEATTSILKSFAEKTLEEIHALVDKTMIKIEAETKLAHTNANLVSNILTKATSSSLSAFTQGITESAYSAANNMLDLAAQERKRQLETQEIELHRQQSLNIREGERGWKQKILDAQIQEGMVRLAATVQRNVAETFNDASVFGISTGDAPGEIADLAGQIEVAFAAANTTYKDIMSQFDLESRRGVQQVTEGALSGVNDVTREWIDAALAVKKEWLKVAQYTEGLLEKADVAAMEMGRSIGKSSASMDEYRETMFKTQISIAQWNKNMEDAMKAQMSYAEGSGRNIELNESDYNKLFALGTLIGDDNAFGLVSQMDYFNKAVGDSSQIFFEMYDKANKAGISNRKYAKDLQNNLKLAQKYTFKGGVKAMMEMSIWAQKTRFNMQNLDSLIGGIQDNGLEGVITKAAKLQVLGGHMAMGSDPLAMMFEAWADPEALIKRFADMTKGIGHFNSKTGEVEIAGPDAMRLKAYAEASGMDYQTARDMVTQRVKSQQINKSLTAEYNDEEKALLYSKAQLGSDGRWMVTVNGQEKDINSLQHEDFVELMPHEEKIEEYVSQILDNTTKLAGTKQRQNATMESATLNIWDSEVEKRIKRSDENFYDNITTYAKEIVGGMMFATQAFSDSFELAKQTNDGIQAEMNGLTEGAAKIGQAFEDASARVNSSTDFLTKALNDFSAHATGGLEDAFNTINGIIDKTQEEDPITGGVRKLSADLANGRIFSAIPRAFAIGGLYIENAFNDAMGIFGKQLPEGSSGSGVRDGIVSSKGNPMSIKAADVTPIQDGSVKLARTDPHDTGLFAKSGGPFDTLFNGVFGKINNVYDSITGNSNKKIQFETLKIELSGNLELTSGGKSINIISELQNNPLLLRSLSRMLAEHVSKSINGGRGDLGIFMSGV